VIDYRKLDEIVKKFRTPGYDRDPKIRGMSYEDYRVSWWNNRIGNLGGYLKENHLNTLTVSEALELYKEVRTAKMKRMHTTSFQKNGIIQIRKSLNYLIYDNTDSVATRIGIFLKNRSPYRLKGTGHDFASTMLFVAKPLEYPIWNTVSVNGLSKLGLLPNTWKGTSPRQKYAHLIQVVKAMYVRYDFTNLGIVDELLYRVDEGKFRISSGLLLQKKTRKKDNRPPELLPSKGDKPSTIVVTREELERDSKVTKYVRDVENATCQVCGIPIMAPNGWKHCHIHHIIPQKADMSRNLDIVKNTLCLCPNHHAEMHLGVFYIDPLTLRIVHHDESHELHELAIRSNHFIEPQSLNYHRKKNCNWAT